MKPRLAKKILTCKSTLCHNSFKVDEAKYVLCKTGYCTMLGDGYTVLCSRRRKGLRK
jgi:hypothetical protein